MLLVCLLKDFAFAEIDETIKDSIVYFFEKLHTLLVLLKNVLNFVTGIVPRILRKRVSWSSSTDTGIFFIDARDVFFHYNSKIDCKSQYE